MIKWSGINNQKNAHEQKFRQKRDTKNTERVSWNEKDKIETNGVSFACVLVCVAHTCKMCQFTFKIWIGRKFRFGEANL